MKKILIIVKKQPGSDRINTKLINEYVETKKSQGYQLELIGDDTGILKELLDEQELWGKKITSAQSNVMFELGSYELIIYVPEQAGDLKDILVYDPKKLDKNMIFYNIGNMLIVDSLGDEDLQQHIESADEQENESNDMIIPSEVAQPIDEVAENTMDENFAAEEEESFEEPTTQEMNEESAPQSSLLTEEAAQELEQENFVSESVTDTSESQEQDAERIANDDYVIAEEVEGEQVQEDESVETLAIETSTESITEISEAQETSDSDSSESDSTEVRNMQEHFSSNYSVIGENETSLSTDEESADEPMPQESRETQDAVTLSHQEESVSSNTFGNIDEIHSDSLITISSDGVTTTSGESQADNLMQEPTSDTESATEREQHEIKRGVSIPRRLWLLAPWIIMGLMTILQYEKVAWIPFILSVLALFGAILSKKSRRLSKTPEFLCIIMSVLALIVNFIYPEWMVAIALPISIMGIILFFIVGFVNWDN